MSTSHPLHDPVLRALRTVQDPDLKQDLVTLGMIQDLRIEPNGTVSLRAVLTTPACPMKEKIRSDIEKAVTAVPGVAGIKITMDAQVRGQKAGAPSASGGGSAMIQGVANIIAVSSGKGGVGKSTVAVNLAVSLALEGAKVGLMDADVYGPNVPTMMGVTDEPKIENHPTRGEIFMPPSSHGVKVMSMGFLIQGDQPLVWRGPMLHNVVSQFCHKVDWGTLDYLIVDMPPGTGDVQLSLAQLVPVTGAVLVTTPQEVSMQDVRKAFHMFEKVRIPVMGIVENMSWFTGDDAKRYYLFGQDGGKVLAKKFNTELLAQLPIMPEVREGGDDGVPIVIRNPKSEVAIGFREFSRKVAQKISIASAESYRPDQIVQIGRFD